MGRQKDKQRYLKTLESTAPSGLQQQAEELTALLADARSYVASDDELPGETAAPSKPPGGKESAQPARGGRHTPPAVHSLY